MSRVETIYTVRPAVKPDSQWLEQLHQEAYTTLSGQIYDDYANAWQRGFFSARIAHPVDIFIISRSRLDIGAIYLEDRTGDIVLESLEILPSHQRQGAGLAAIEWILERASSSGSKVTLKVHKANPDAKRLYDRCGFRVCDETTTHFLMCSFVINTDIAQVTALRQG